MPQRQSASTTPSDRYALLDRAARGGSPDQTGVGPGRSPVFFSGGCTRLNIRGAGRPPLVVYLVAETLISGIREPARLALGERGDREHGGGASDPPKIALLGFFSGSAFSLRLTL
jgi:hypothetical protein